MTRKFFIALFVLIILALPVFFMPKANASIEKAQDTTTKIDVKREIHNFIPFDNLYKILETRKNLVFMSYKELKDLINSRIKPEPKAPVNYVIKSSDLKGVMEDKYIAFSGDIKFEVFNEKWVDIKFLSTNVNIEKAKLNGKDAPISIKGNNFIVSTNKKGEHNLNVKFNIKKKTEGINSSANFELAPVPISKISIKYPLTFSDLKISDSSGSTTYTGKDYKTTGANLKKSGKVALFWKSFENRIIPVKNTKPIKQKVNKATKVIAETKSLITIDEGLLQGFNEYELQVFYNPIEKISLNIPDNIEVIDVTGNKNIIKPKSFRITDQDEEIPGKLLEIFLTSKVKGGLEFNIAFEKSFNNEKTIVEIPALKLLGEEINRVSGYLAVQNAGNAEIKTAKTENLSTVDISDIPEDLDSLVEYPVISTFAFIKDDYNLKCEIIPHKDAPVQVAVADSSITDSRLSKNGVLTSKAEYKIRNTSEQYFKFSLPKTAEVLTALINNAPVQIEATEPSDGSKNIYLINIKEYQDKGAFNLVVMYRQKHKANFLTKLFNKAGLTRPIVLNMPVLTVFWKVYLPQDMKYAFFTPLSKGNKNYSNYIPAIVPDKGYLFRNNNGYRTKKQISNFYDGDTTSLKKVAGILPPEFSMPPIKGLSLYEFSGYLPEKEFNKISFLGISDSITIIFLLITMYLGWFAAGRVQELIKNNKFYSTKTFGVSFVILLLVYLVGSYLYTITFAVSAASYFIYHKFVLINTYTNKEVS